MWIGTSAAAGFPLRALPVDYRLSVLGNVSNIKIDLTRLVSLHLLQQTKGLGRLRRIPNKSIWCKESYLGTRLSCLDWGAWLFFWQRHYKKYSNDWLEWKIIFSAVSAFWYVFCRAVVEHAYTMQAAAWLDAVLHSWKEFEVLDLKLFVGK